MVDDDPDDDWPELDPEREAERMAAQRERLESLRAVRRRILRWTYAGLGVLVILIIVLVALR